MYVTDSTRHHLRLNHMIFVLLLLLIISLLAWLSTRYDYQADWTASGRNSLSQISLTVLEKMPGPVTVTAFAREVGVLRPYIKDLMARYSRHKDDFILKFVNPDIEPQRIRDLNITVDGEMLIEYQGRSEQLKDFSEHALTNALQRLMRNAQRQVLFVQGHGERKPHGTASYDMSNWTLQMERKGIDVATVNLARDGMLALASTSLLVLTSPRSDYLPAEVDIIHDYIKLGGSLLWLLDPGSLHGLERLLEQLPLRLQPGLIIDPNISQLGMMMFGTDDPRITLVANYPEHPLVEGFSFNTLFPMAQSVALAESTAWLGDVFLRSMTNTWLETGEKTGQLVYDGNDLPGPLSLGVSLVRQINQADEQVDPDADNVVMAAEQRIVVIGDGDFVSNGFLGLGGNLQLAMNIVNWLSRDDQLLSVPIKSVADNSLQLSKTAVVLMGFGFLVLLPLVLLLCGFLIWWRRRKY